MQIKGKNLKKISLCLLLFCWVIFVFAQEFVSPINFQSTEKNKQKVINFIKEKVKKTYSEINMNDPSTLKMMEKENLKAFKNLIKAKDIELLKRVIKNYKDIGMDDYNTLWMMYQEQLKAKEEELQW